MIKTEQNIVDIIKKGQSGFYDKNASIIRNFTGKLSTVMELRNPLDGSILISDIDRLLQIMNPALETEIAWFKEAQGALKMWVNDLIASNRLLGIKNDNTYDTTAFEKAIMQHFFIFKKPNPNAIIETDFKTMVELVEIGARRFGR
jgi:hypothetical protein